MPIPARTHENGADGAPRRHIYGLDAVRFLAALGVGIFHLSWRYPPLAGLPPVGWIGVQIFFVLSGFVIAGSTEGATATSFLRKRFLRLYPTAWLCTALGVVVILALGRPGDAIGIYDAFGTREVVSSVLLVGNTFIASAYWTLPIELAFYGLVFLLLLAGRSVNLEILAQALLVWSGVYMLAYLAWTLDLVAIPWIELDYGKRNMTLLRHGHYFGLGILLFLCFSGRGARRYRGWIGLAVAIALVEIGCRANEIGGKAASDFAFPTIFGLATIIWAGFCLSMVAAIRYNSRVPSGPRWHRWLRTLGLMSYPFYLLHESVGGSAMAWLVLRGVPPVPALATGLAVTGLASVLIADLAEPRLQAVTREVLARLSGAGRALGAWRPAGRERV